MQRLWPEAPPPGAHSLPALNVVAADFLYANRTMCYVHHNISYSRIVCVDVDDFTRQTVLPAPALFPDIACE